MFEYSIVGLLVLAALFILWPILRHYHSQNGSHDRETSNARGERESENIALYRERLAELDEELALGNMERPQFEDLQLELKRSLLADVGERTGISSTDKSSAGSAEDFTASSDAGNDLATQNGTAISRLVPLLIALLIPVVSYELYAKWGYADDVKLTDLYQQAIHNVGDADEASTLILRLKEAVQEDRDNQWAWYFLGKNYFSLGMYGLSEEAYQHSMRYMELEADRIMVMAQYVLASFMNAERKLNSQARSVIDQALEINPNEYTILRILATDAEQRQDYPAAIKYWRQLIRINPNSSAARIMQSNIAAAQGLLDPEHKPSTEDREQAAPATTIDYASAAPATYPATGSTTAYASSSATAPNIDIELSLAAGLDLPADLRLFVAARNASRQGMPPLAAIALRVADLPMRIRLDNSSAVGPFNLSSADRVYVSALVSFSGTASPQSGDYRIVSEPFNHKSQNSVIELVLAEEVP